MSLFICWYPVLPAQDDWVGGGCDACNAIDETAENKRILIERMAKRAILPALNLASWFSFLFPCLPHPDRQQNIAVSTELLRNRGQYLPLGASSSPNVKQW